MRSYSPSVKQLCERWDSAIPELAITTAVETTFPELDLARGPIDVISLARKRKTTIVPGETDFDGVISRAPGGNYTIRLNEQHPEQRKRFTIAHEIGHTFFFDLEDSSAARYRLEDSSVEGINANWEEEYICNVAAAEILMPFNIFSAEMRSLPPVAKSILKLSRHFKTSLRATARRFVQLSPYKLMVCLWQYVTEVNSYETLWIARPYRTKRGSSQIFFVSADQPIFKAFDSEQSFRGRKWVSLGGPLDDYFVDGLVIGSGSSRNVLTVFILEKFADRLAGNPNGKVLLKQQLRLF